MNLTYSATGYKSAGSSGVVVASSGKSVKPRKTPRWRPYLTRSWQRNSCGRLESRDPSSTEDGYNVTAMDCKPNKISSSESVEDYLVEYNKRIKKKLLERGIRNHHELEVALNTSPFGKIGHHEEAKEKLEGLSEIIESYSADSKRIKIGRVGDRLPGSNEWDTGVRVTFTPKTWIYHAIYRRNKRVPYYASDLFRLNFLKAEMAAEFTIRWPETIVVEHIREKSTLRKMESLDMGTSSGIDVFLNETRIGKHMTKVFEDFGFAIDSIVCIEHLMPGSNVVLRVKSVL